MQDDKPQDVQDKFELPTWNVWDQKKKKKEWNDEKKRKRGKEPEPEPAITWKLVQCNWSADI